MLDIVIIKFYGKHAIPGIPIVSSFKHYGQHTNNVRALNPANSTATCNLQR